jgi:hypothetical protein
MPDSDSLVAQSHIELEDRIRRRAHEIWLSHQNKNGADTALQDWLQAEEEVLAAHSAPEAQNRATVVGDAHKPDFSQMEQLGEA